MSDTLQEREDARTRHEQIGGEYRCNKCRAEFKTIPDFDKHECKQQREDQMDQHQSATCTIPECPCREWSSQIAAAENSRQRREAIKLSQAVARAESAAKEVSDQTATTTPQPAARGGGERVILNSDLVVRPLPNTLLKTRCLLAADDGWPIAEFYREEEAEGIAYEHNQHHSLVAEREQMVEALKGVAIMLNTELEKYNKEPWAQRVRAAITASEQRSTSE